MPWGIAAGAIGGALISSNSASNASDAQSASAAQSDATQRYIYDQSRADNAATRERGEAAGNRLSSLMGLSGSATDPGYGSLAQNFSEAAPEMRQFGASDYANDFVAQNGLQFGLDEGRRGIERQQQASGGLLSGATLKALSRFGNDYGTRNTAGAYDRFTGEQNRDYGQYVDRYNRFNTDQGTQFNRLSGIAGTGQAATGQVGAAGQNYANAVGQTAQGLGNAQGAAAIAQGNAWSGGIQSGINNYQQNRLIDMYGQRGGSGVRMGGSGQSVWGSGNAFSGTGDY